jgi:hypothetical protein
VIGHLRKFVATIKFYLKKAGGRGQRAEGFV